MAKALNQRRSRVAVMDAPVKGWVANGSLLSEKPGTAIVLDNWFPEAQTVRPRKGNVSHINAGHGPCETLMTFTSSTSSKLFAAAEGHIYDYSFSGPEPAPLLTGLLSNKWQYVMHATTGGQFLVITNGSDSVRNYNGAVWSTPVLTGATSANMIHVTSHKKRLWFVEKNSSTVYFLAADAIAGALTAYPLGSLLKLGGYIMAAATWSVDAGSGMDDNLLFWSSEGEVIVFSGTDPAVAANWNLIGVYTVGKPIGRRCIQALGGDLALISQDGILSASQMMQIDRVVASKYTLSVAIKDAYADAVRDYKNNFGWQLTKFSAQNMLVLNVPSNPSTQFVLNSTTGAWCRYVGFDAISWEVFQDKIFYGTPQGDVFQAETGGSDNGVMIDCVMLPSFSTFGNSGINKHVKFMRALIEKDIQGGIPEISISVDYKKNFNQKTSLANNNQTVFIVDLSLVDGPDLIQGNFVNDDWRSTSNYGYSISPYTKCSFDEIEDFNYDFKGWMITYQIGGII